MEKKTKKTYPQKWSAYNCAQTNEKLLFQALLYELCQEIYEVPQTTGRPHVSIADLIFCAALKVYTTLSARRNMSDLCAAQQSGYISKAINHRTLSKYLQQESLTLYLHQLIDRSSLPLRSVECDFAVDATGFSTNRFVRWFDVKHGGTEDWHDWVKLHLVCGVKTHIVTAVEVSARYANDHPFMKPLLETTARNGFRMSEVSADKAYLSATNMRLILLKGAIPYIPFKKNSNSSAKSTIWNRMLHLYRFHQDEFNVHYHKRSNVETTFAMIKAKFSDRLRSKTRAAQVNEVLCKVLCHNICVVIQSIYELGVEPNFSEALSTLLPSADRTLGQLR